MTFYIAVFKFFVGSERLKEHVAAGRSVEVRAAAGNELY